jgi:hypothetical protein
MDDNLKSARDAIPFWSFSTAKVQHARQLHGRQELGRSEFVHPELKKEKSACGAFSLRIFGKHLCAASFPA